MKREVVSMKKDIARREFLKLKFDGYSYAACQKELFRRHDFTASISTLKWWWKRFNQGDWNLRDIPQRPHTIHHQYATEDLEKVIDLRKKTGYSAYQLKEKGTY